MKILTIKQPWAWAIFHAGKDVENRKYLPKYRGPLGIHAAKLSTTREYEIAADFIRSLGHTPPTLEELRERGETGAILGTVDFVGTKTDSDWYLGHLWRESLIIRRKTLLRMGSHDLACHRIDSSIAYDYQDCSGWHFANPVALPKPIAAAGRLGLWDFDLGVAA